MDMVSILQYHLWFFPRDSTHTHCDLLWQRLVCVMVCSRYYVPITVPRNPRTRCLQLQSTDECMSTAMRINKLQGSQLHVAVAVHAVRVSYRFINVKNCKPEHSKSTNLCQGNCIPNPNITWGWSPPKSEWFLLVMHWVLQKISSKFYENLLVILLTERQKNKKCGVKRTLLGEVNDLFFYVKCVFPSGL